MALKISSDVSTNIDISCRKGDNFFLNAVISNSDGTRFNISTYSILQLIVTNANDNTVRKFHNTSGTDGNIDFFSTISSANHATTGISINAAGGKMNIPAGTYKYVFKIASNTNTHTILDGKFKVID